jgi:hypothetical protein
MHWGNGHKLDCGNMKKLRTSKWREICVLATAYTEALEKVSALSNAIIVWQKVTALKREMQPTSPLVTRLAEI